MSITNMAKRFLTALAIIAFLLGVFILTATNSFGLNEDGYEKAIPSKKDYRIEVSVHCLTWPEWKEFIDREYGTNRTSRDQQGNVTGIVGVTITLTGRDGRVKKDVYLPIEGDGTIDLNNLGHEIFYHVLENHQH
jgi:hypothetical protein